MKTIEELAAELGKAIKEDPRLDAMEKAKTAYDNDPKIQAYLAEFEVQQKALQLEGSKEDGTYIVYKVTGSVTGELHLYSMILRLPLMESVLTPASTASKAA